MVTEIGKSVSAAAVEGTLHVDRYLTNYSVMFVQESSMFLAQQAASLIPVQNQTDKYVIYDRGYFWRDEAAVRPLGGRPSAAQYKISSATYSADEYGLEHVIDDRLRANTDDPIRLDENASTLLTQKNLIKQDPRRWRVMTQTNLPASSPRSIESYDSKEPRRAGS